MKLGIESGALGRLGTAWRIFNMQESGKALYWVFCLFVFWCFFGYQFLICLLFSFCFCFFFQLQYIQSKLRKAAEINSNEIKYDKNISWQQE